MLFELRYKIILLNGFSHCRKLFLDALFRAGTGDAVEVAVELLKSKKITGPYADLYYSQFAYTKHVTLAALTAAVVSENYYL
jgi:hypothetical protein